MPFFPNLSKKSLLSCLYFLKKKMRIFSKIFCSHVHISLKKRPFSQEHRAPMSSFSNLSWKVPSCQAHIWSKNVIFNTTLYYGPNKSICYLFFPNFRKKKLRSRPYFDKKRLCSKKHHIHIL